MVGGNYSTSMASKADREAFYIFDPASEPCYLSESTTRPDSCSHSHGDASLICLTTHASFPAETQWIAHYETEGLSGAAFIRDGLVESAGCQGISPGGNAVFLMHGGTLLRERIPVVNGRPPVEIGEPHDITTIL